MLVSELNLTNFTVVMSYENGVGHFTPDKCQNMIVDHSLSFRITTGDTRWDFNKVKPDFNGKWFVQKSTKATFWSPEFSEYFENLQEALDHAREF